MAGAKPTSPLDTLEVLVNDVLVQAGKAFKSSRRDARRVPSLASVNRIRDIHVDFNTALDDVESELIRAKAVLQRDLDQLRAKRRPVVIPEPVMIPLAPTGPAPGPPASAPQPAAAAPGGPALGHRNIPKQPALHQPPVSRPVPRPKQGAPFPNMGINPLPPVPGPQPAVPNVKQEPHAVASAKPQPTAQAAKPAAKGSSPIIKNASSSPALKSIPPAGKTTSPVKKVIVPPATKPDSPAQKTMSSLPAGAKTGSPVTVPAKPAPKATPPTASRSSLPPTSAPNAAAPVATAAAAAAAAAAAPAPPNTHVPVPVPAPTPVAPTSAAMPAPVPGPNAAVPVQSMSQPDPLAGLLEIGDEAASVGGGSGGGGGGLLTATTSTPHLNFTDMQFSLAPGNLDSQSQPQNNAQAGTATDGMDTEFDLETFVADATNNILSDSFSGSAGEQSSVTIAGSSSRPIDLASGGSAPFKPSEADAVTNNMDDLFKLDGDMELGATGDTNFDNLWIDGETTMEDFDAKYFDLT